MKKTLLNTIKLLITSLLFYFILKDQNLEKIGKMMLEADLTLLLFSIIIYISVFVVFAIRWSLINSIYEIKISLYELFKDYLIAFALNNVLPSSIGGDVWRMKQLKDVTKSKSKSIMIPVIERISGFVAVILVAPVSFFYFTQYDIEQPFIVLVFLIFTLLIALFSARLSQLTDRFFKRKFSNNIYKNWTSLKYVLELIQKRKLIFLTAVSLSLLSQLIFALSAKLVLNSLNVNIAYFEMLSIIPLIYVVTIIPISINGFGIREKFMSDAFVYFSISAELSIAGAFLVSVQQIFVGLIGALIILNSKKKKSK